LRILTPQVSADNYRPVSLIALAIELFLLHKPKLQLLCF